MRNLSRKRCVLAFLPLIIMLFTCGCFDKGSSAYLPYIIEHLPADEHSLEQIWRECALRGSPSLDSLNAENAILGTLSEQDPASRTDETLSYFPWSCDEQFRMAMIIYTNTGEKVTDFFKGVPVKGGVCVGSGNAFLKIPHLFEDHVQTARRSAPVEVASDGPVLWNHSLIRFAELFPELINQEFSLTFKEFRGHVYYLTNVPKGTAFIWFQTTLDGNRVIQSPVMVQLDPEKGAIKRLDIVLVCSRLHFFVL